MKTLLKSLILFSLITINSKVNGQNYLYKKDDGGLSGYLGMFSEDLRDRDAYGFGADFTFNGYFSVGISRVVVINGFNSNEGVTSLSASATPIKKEKGNLTFSIPLFVSSTISQENSILTLGGGLAFMNQLNTKTSVTPVLSLGFNSVKYYNNRSNWVGVIGFEINIVVNKLRIVPSLSFAEQNALFGISGGFVL